MKYIKIVGMVDGKVTGSTYEIGVDMSEETAENLVTEGVAVDVDATPDAPVEVASPDAVEPTIEVEAPTESATDNEGDE